MCDQDARVRCVTRNESGLRDEENILQWLAQIDVDGHLTQPVELIGVSIADGVRQQQARRRRLIRRPSELDCCAGAIEVMQVDTDDDGV